MQSYFDFWYLWFQKQNGSHPQTLSTIILQMALLVENATLLPQRHYIRRW